MKSCHFEEAMRKTWPERSIRPAQHTSLASSQEEDADTNVDIDRRDTSERTLGSGRSKINLSFDSIVSKTL